MVLKHFISVSQRPEPEVRMKRKQKGCLNHNLTLTTSEKPSVSPTAALTVRPSIYQAGIASFLPLAAVKGAETHYICICQSSEVSMKRVMVCCNHSLKEGHMPKSNTLYCTTAYLGGCIINNNL
jgi:hypothetical protein